MTRSRIGTGGLIIRHLRTGVAAAILVGLLVALGSFAASIAPRALSGITTAQLQSVVESLPAAQRDLSATGAFGLPTYDNRAPLSSAEMFGGFATTVAAVRTNASAPLADVLSAPEWVVVTSPQPANPMRAGEIPLHPVVSLAVDPAWSTRVRLVDGTAPAPWTGQDTDALAPAARAPIDIALSEATARMAGLHVGDILDSTPARLRISALYAPRNPDASYWEHEPDLKVGSLFTSTNSTLLYSSAFIDPESAVGLRDTFGSAKGSVWYLPRVDELRFEDADRLAAQARELEAAGQSLPGGGSVDFTWGLPRAISSVQARVALVTSLLALTASGPVGVLLLVLALGVQSVVERRRASFGLLRSRGGSTAQLRGIAALEGIVISVPAAVLGSLAAAWVIPGAAGPDALVLPALLALAPPVLFAVFSTRDWYSARRNDLRVRSRGSVRWVAEVAVLALAALSLFTLFRRGLAEVSLTVGVDPLLVATPLLLSLAVCVLVLRAYPALMAIVQGWARSGRGAVGLIGPARATRSPALGFLAALALIVGMSTAVFSTVLSTTVGAALTRDARVTVGADARVDADRLDAALRDRVARLPGVEAIASLQRVPNVVVQTAGNSIAITVVTSGLADLERVRPDLALQPAREGTFRVYLSHDLAGEIGGAPITIGGRDARVAGDLASDAMPGAGTEWALIDVADAERSGFPIDPDALLIAFAPGADPGSTSDSIARTVRSGQEQSDRADVVLTQTSHVLATATSEPVISGLESALLISAVVSALLSMLAVVLAAVATAPARNRLIGVLRILGVSLSQVRRLTVWELLPITLTAIIAGTLLGLAELWIVSVAVDLRPFLAGTGTPTPMVDPVALGVVVITVGIVVAIAGLLTVEVGRRRSPAGSIKMGTE